MGLQKGLKNGEPLQIPTYNRKAGEGAEYSLAQPASCHDDTGESAAELIVILG